LGIVCAIAAGFAIGAAMLPPLAQSPAYHEFADDRSIFGIANVMDVASNLPFLLIGVAGLLALRSEAAVAFRNSGERWIYALFFLGVAFTSVGSAYYHMAPDNARLVWDRLPMTIAFMSLVAATWAERIDTRAGVRLLVPLLALGIASVVYWRLSAVHGVENLRPYLAVQYGSIAVVLAIAALLPSAYTGGNGIYAVAALYGFAKVAEHFDAAIFEQTSLVSGHSVKHLLAACAIYRILRMLEERAVVGRQQPKGEARSSH
jgi:hypothetical protein